MAQLLQALDQDTVLSTRPRPNPSLHLQRLLVPDKCRMTYKVIIATIRTTRARKAVTVIMMDTRVNMATIPNPRLLVRGIPQCNRSELGDLFCLITTDQYVQGPAFSACARRLRQRIQFVSQQQLQSHQPTVLQLWIFERTTSTVLLQPEQLPLQQPSLGTSLESTLV